MVEVVAPVEAGALVPDGVVAMEGIGTEVAALGECAVAFDPDLEGGIVHDGLGCLAGAVFVSNVYLSSFLGVFGASALWGIKELFEQKKRVERGWFKKNPRRKR